MIISPFTPLFFDTRKSDGVQSRYIQTFANTDQILLEAFDGPDSDITVTVVDECNGTEEEMSCNSYEYGDENWATKMTFTVITGMSDGYYHVVVTENESNISKQSETFRVTSDENELKSTSLIQYSMKDNRQRTDTRFVIDGMRYFFDFRVPGGFKDSGWTFGVDNEQFVTPDADIMELYAQEYTQKRLTVGGQDGVPVVFGELLNRILTCNYVYVDGVRYARVESSTPEMTVQIEGLDSFVFNQSLQQISDLDPITETYAQIALRRVTSDLDSGYRATNSNNTRMI